LTQNSQSLDNAKAPLSVNTGSYNA